MPTRISYNRDRTVGYLFFSGLVPVDELLDACRAILTPASEAPAHVIWNLLEARMSLGPEDLTQIVECVRESPAKDRPGRVAVVSADPALHMIVRVLDARLSEVGRPYAAHTSLEAAERWVAEGDA